MRLEAIRFWVPRRLKLHTQYSPLLAEKKDCNLSNQYSTKKKKIIHVPRNLQSDCTYGLETKYHKCFIRMGDFKHMDLLKTFLII